MLLDNKKSRQESGFTLVELLVVILIIGVLAAIAIPAFNNQRRKANDAALETDMRNVAMSFKTWQTIKGNDNDRYREVIGDQANSYVEHPEGENATSPAISRWHEIPELPDTSVSPGSVIEVIVVLPRATNSTWTTPHEEGEFCLVGSMRNSSWDYVPNAGMGFQHYNRLLFYDSKLGGVRTFEQVLESFEAGEEISCHGHPRRYVSTVVSTGN